MCLALWESHYNLVSNSISKGSLYVGYSPAPAPTENLVQLHFTKLRFKHNRQRKDALFLQQSRTTSGIILTISECLESKTTIKSVLSTSAVMLFQYTVLESTWKLQVSGGTAIQSWVQCTDIGLTQAQLVGKSVSLYSLPIPNADQNQVHLY